MELSRQSCMYECRTKKKFREKHTEISIYINCRCTTKGIFFFFYNANPLSKIGDSNLSIRSPLPSIFAATCSFAKGKERSLKFIIRNKWCDNDGNILRYSRIRFIRFLCSCKSILLAGVKKKDRKEKMEIKVVVRWLQFRWARP